MSHEFQSPLRRWDVVAGLCQSIDARTYVEIGCKEGRTTGFVLANCPNVRAIAIDPWCQQEAGADVTRETYKDWNFADIERQFWENVGDNRQRCSMLRMTGEQARDVIAQDDDEDTRDDRGLAMVDVVFIDALHDYGSVQIDILDWWPRVRPGGYLVLHDYNHKWPGVMRAVAEAFPLFKVGLAPDSVAFIRKEALQ